MTENHGIFLKKIAKITTELRENHGNK